MPPPVSNPITIHVGLPKTGSTSMQQGLWRRIPGLDFIGPNLDGDEDEILINRILSLEECKYRPLKEEFTRRFSDRFQHELPILISNEKIAQGANFLPSLVPFGDRTLIAARLNELLPGSRILLVLRNQFNLMLSLFGERLKGPHVASHSFHQWFNLQKGNELRGLGSFFDIGDYFPLYCSYRDIFGASRVKVVLFEEFVKNPENFHRETLTFMGLDWEKNKKYWEPIHSNSRVSQAELFLQKMMWRFPGGRNRVPRNLRHRVRDASRKFFRIRPSLKQEEEEFLIRFFGESNRRLQAELDLHLSAHGYPL